MFLVGRKGLFAIYDTQKSLELPWEFCRQKYGHDILIGIDSIKESDLQASDRIMPLSVP